MKLSINLADDNELRREIRDMVDAQVRSIVREEVISAVVQVVNEKITANDKTFWDMLKRVVEERIRVQYWEIRKAMSDPVDQDVKAAVKEATSGLAKKVQDMARLEIDRRVNNLFGGTKE